MSETTGQLKDELQKSLHLLGTLRDEVRLKLHLAGMDAKDRWKALNAEVDKVSHRTALTSHTIVEELVTQVRAFKASLRGDG
ncbi:MAG: hypothetical protein JWN44_5897 [Myxococcales bacterium]|nr:hypothetical protein [Myxococcales bacterium]